MGCVSSRRDINDIHPNIFQVMNVDELGQHVSPGQLELTESELVLYQRGKAATRWPLRCLRRYGFDAEIFSFESGRRCPTGPGIYAFRCRRAEQLFILLQQNIQLRNLSDEIITVASELSVPIPQQQQQQQLSQPPAVNTRQPDQYLELTNTRNSIGSRVQTNSRFSRPGSVTSNGPASPPSASSPTPLTSESTCHTSTQEHNNNKRAQHSYTNTLPLLEAVVDNTLVQPYMNLEPTSSPTLSSSSEPYAQLNLDSEECCHVYMNVLPGSESTNTITTTTTNTKPEPVADEEDPRHCYANLNPNELDTKSLELNTRKVNYIVLDLDQTKSEPSVGAVAPTAGAGVVNNPSVPAAPDSPRRPTKGYATIDFNKTVALSHSVNPCLELDNEGSRKTRHNSTIGELAPVLARHSTSLSD